MSTHHPDRERILELAARGEAQASDLELSIARTRADLDLHMKAVESRLSRDELIGQAMSYLRQGPGEYFSNFGRTVKSNPIPVALLTLSVGWLMFESQRAGRSNGSDPYALPASPPAGERLASSVETVRQHAAEFTQDAGGAAAGVGDKAQRAVERASAGAAHIRSTVRDQARRMQIGYHNLVNEHPLVLGLLAFAVGSVVAASLPRTRREDELMGEASDQTVAAVQTSVEAVAEKAEQALDRASNDPASAPERPSSRPKPDRATDGDAGARVKSELAAEGVARP